MITRKLIQAAAILLVIALSSVAVAAPKFQLGIHVLLHDRLDLIQGKNIGLITNPTGVNVSLVSDVDLLAHTPNVHLVALFGPEHGIRGAHQAGAHVGTYRDPETGVPVYSLYGKHRQPTPQMLKNVDVLIYDIQPVGTRFYTYLYTMADAMKAAAAAHIPFIVLDRPNPIGGIAVQGPVLEPKYASFVGQYPIALRYGMTVGELAKLFNDTFHIGANLTVVKMRGWHRSMYYDDTPLQFVMPSPNMPTLKTALVYPGFGLVEGTNVSEGRGTTRPFELIGAPWINAKKLADTLNQKHLAGARFRPVHFTPTFSKYQGKPCNGIQVHVLDRKAFNPVVAGLTAIETIRELYPKQFKFKKSHFDHLIGNDWVRQDIEHDVPVTKMQAHWQKRLEQFKKLRNHYLLYD
ncbi:MAG TPA: DUF1343 domain-containing protein [Gammaproteobacteria bacterium]|nr:DUF1343 domain-containing protein [Gammaproteobacteria bacterium]